MNQERIESQAVTEIPESQAVTEGLIELSNDNEVNYIKENYVRMSNDEGIDEESERLDGEG